MTENRNYGYARVSTEEQNEGRQVVALMEAGVQERDIYVDKASGKDFDRPAYKALVRSLRKGDTLYILSIDRLGRDYSDIAHEWQAITQDIGADIVVLDMPLLDTRKSGNIDQRFIADMVLQLLSYVAQRERESIRKRQAEGIALAKEEDARLKAAGKEPVHYLGRKPIAVDGDAFKAVYAEWKADKITARAAMDKLGIKPNTFYRRVKELESMGA